LGVLDVDWYLLLIWMLKTQRRHFRILEKLPTDIAVTCGCYYWYKDRVYLDVDSDDVIFTPINT
jgi:hypothetical protein